MATKEPKTKAEFDAMMDFQFDCWWDLRPWEEGLPPEAVDRFVRRWPNRQDELPDMLAHYANFTATTTPSTDTAIPADNGGPSGTIASGIASEAARIVAGDRNVQHGDKERSFVAIARLWNAYLLARKETREIDATDVAQMMVLLKIARSVQGAANHRDHYVDAVGYAAIAGELALTRAGESKGEQSK